MAAEYIAGRIVMTPGNYIIFMYLECHVLAWLTLRRGCFAIV